MTWTWTLTDASGRPVEQAGASAAAGPGGGFPVQADAETWLGESWRELLAAGVEQAWLRHHDVAVYGPLDLRPSS